MSWRGVKKQSIKAEIEAWCEEMGIKKYTINSKGEIDVNGDVDLSERDFEELPYKFGIVNKMFSLRGNENLTSLKNCPNIVDHSFVGSNCSQLDSLEGCPKYVGENFWCMCCQREFTEEEVKSLCDVYGRIINNLIVNK